MSFTSRKSGISARSGISATRMTGSPMAVKATAKVRAVTIMKTAATVTVTAANDNESDGDSDQEVDTSKMVARVEVTKPVYVAVVTSTKAWT